MSDDVDIDGQVFKGRRYPADVEPLQQHTYRYKIGDNQVEDLGWQGHMKVAHDAGMTSREIDVIDSGLDDAGLRYAVVKATVVIGDDRFEAIQAADEATNQVRDPEYVWAVASSRAFKRAVKMALNVYPVDADSDPEKHRVEDSGGSVRRGDDGPIVDPPDEYKNDGDDDGAGPEPASGGDFEF